MNLRSSNLALYGQSLLNECIRSKLQWNRENIDYLIYPPLYWDEMNLEIMYYLDEN